MFKGEKTDGGAVQLIFRVTPNCFIDGMGLNGFDSRLSSVFSLASRDRRNGKQKPSAPISENGSHRWHEGGKLQSGIKNKNMENVVNEQLYPQ